MSQESRYCKCLCWTVWMKDCGPWDVINHVTLWGRCFRKCWVQGLHLHPQYSLRTYLLYLLRSSYSKLVVWNRRWTRFTYTTIPRYTYLFRLVSPIYFYDKMVKLIQHPKIIQNFYIDSIKIIPTLPEFWIYIFIYIQSYLILHQIYNKVFIQVRLFQNP